MYHKTKNICLLLFTVCLFSLPLTSLAAEGGFISELIDSPILQDSGQTEVSSAIKVIVLLTVLSLIPAILIATTSFLRIIIVLSMLRHAVGMQDTPPNVALISIAIFLTLFSMQPVWNEINNDAWKPFNENEISMGQAIDTSVKHLRTFMVKQTREQDLALMVELSNAESPETIEDINTLQLIPAFMLSELKSAFQVGFMIFLPFLLVDLVVASILTSLGMMMVPPITIALPLKVLMFILIDGWSLVVSSVMGSFS